MQLRTGWLRRWALRAIVLGLIAWLSVSALAVWKLTSRPRPPRAEQQPDWLHAEDVRLTTRDGEELGAWFEPGAPGKPVVLLFHGMGGSRTSEGPWVRRVAKAGYGFLAVSLRCFGDSSGDSVDFGWSSRADVLAAVELVEARKPGAALIVVGQSLGAAAAIYAAPELGRRVSGYVLEAPYRDLEKACRDRLVRRLFAPLDTLAFLGLRLWAPCFLDTDLGSLRPIDSVAQFPEELPVLFVAGDRDDDAPAEDVRLLSERCSGDAALVVIDGCDHKGLWTMDDRHWALWRDFLVRFART